MSDVPFDEARYSVSLQQGTVTAQEFIDGRSWYRDIHGENPKSCIVSSPAYEDMVMDSTLRDIMVTEKEVYQIHGRSAPDDIAPFAHHETGTAVGMIMGMPIVLADSTDETVVVLWDAEAEFDENAVKLSG